MIELGSPAIPTAFGKTPYENTLDMFRERLGVNLKERFRSILERRGSGIDVDDLVEEIEDVFTPFMETLSAGLPEEERDPWIGLIARWLWLCFQHFAEGEKVFRIHENLGKALNATDLRVPSVYLNLPYEGMCLSYEGAVAEISGQGLNSVYLTSRNFVFRANEPNPRFMIFSVTGSDGTASPILEAGITLGQGTDVIDENFVFRTLGTGPENPNAQLVTLALKTIAYINSAGADAIEEPAPAQTIEATLTDPRLMPPQRQERRKLQKRLERASRQPFIYIGSRLPTPREELVFITEGGVRKLTHRFSVRGHFHGFWKLEKNLAPDERSWIQEREGDWVLVLKWIHPYEKGPTEAEKLHRRYFVE